MGNVLDAPVTEKDVVRFERRDGGDGQQVSHTHRLQIQIAYRLTEDRLRGDPDHSFRGFGLSPDLVGRSVC